MPDTVTLLAAYEALNMPNKPSWHVFEAAHQAPVKTAIRYNPNKGNPYSSGQSIAWNEAGLLLDERPLFAKDPLWHAGAYYVQESSSMFLRHAFLHCLPHLNNIRVLDLCAAPGGKSTDIASLLNPDSLLISNEIIPNRNTVLCENITKWGQLNTWVTQMEPQKWQKVGTFFDCIIVDAPCTGSGLWKRDPQALQEWSTDVVTKCATRQANIIQDILPALKPGGILIYSTCSFSMEENESIVDDIMEQHGLENIEIPVEPNWNIEKSSAPKLGGAGYRFSPWSVPGEGFFLAAFQKPGTLQDNIVKATPTKVDTAVQDLFDIPIHAITQKELTLAIPATLHHSLSLLQDFQVYFKKVGTQVGTWMRDTLIPDHELALSVHLQSPYEKIELALEDALQYLRKNNLDNTQNLTGWKLMTYQDVALGWSKWMPGRMNNYYPKHWRLLHY